MSIRVNVRHTIGDLASDLAKIPPMARKDLRAKVNEGARAGNMLAKEYARISAGAHGRHYHRAFTWESTGANLFGNGYSAEYGPQIDRPQGGMSFEYGSRNQKPHLDLNRSADIIGPSLAQEVRALPDNWFWPDS